MLIAGPIVARSHFWGVLGYKSGVYFWNRQVLRDQAKALQGVQESASIATRKGVNRVKIYLGNTGTL